MWFKPQQQLGIIILMAINQIFNGNKYARHVLPDSVQVSWTGSGAFAEVVEMLHPLPDPAYEVVPLGHLVATVAGTVAAYHPVQVLQQANSDDIIKSRIV